MGDGPGQPDQAAGASDEADLDFAECELGGLVRDDERAGSAKYASKTSSSPSLAMGCRLLRAPARLMVTADRLDEICGVGRTVAQVIIAEIGVDMSRFPTPGHLVSWARFAPGVKESAGRRNGNATTGHGNHYLARVLGEAAVAAGRTNTFHPWESATGASPDAAAPSGPSSRSAAPS